MNKSVMFLIQFGCSCHSISTMDTNLLVERHFSIVHNKAYFLFCNKVFILLGRNLFYIRRTPTRRTRLKAFYDYTNTMVWEQMSARQVTHPGLTNLEFGRVYLYFRYYTFGLFSGESRGCEPRVKKLQPNCADRAANSDLPVI